MHAPVGDVSTTLGVFVTAIDRMIREKLDSEYTWRFPGERDSIDKLRDIIGSICITHEDHCQQQLLNVIEKISKISLVCLHSSCQEEELHSLLMTCAIDLADMPSKVYADSISAGKLPGFSMN